MGFGFILNPDKDRKFFEFSDNFFSDFIKKQNFKFLDSQTGRIYNETGYIHFDEFSLIEIRIGKHLNKIKKLEKEHLRKRLVGKMYFWENLKIKDISIKLKMQRHKIKKILWGLRYNRASFSDGIIEEKFKSELLLCENFKLILKLFKATGYSAIPLNKQYVKFINSKPELEMISFKKFNWFCQNVIGIKYAKLHRIQKHCDGDNLKKSRYIISLHLLQFIRKKFHLIFYDSSSLCQSNFKNSVWTLKTGANRKICRFRSFSDLLQF